MSPQKCTSYVLECSFAFRHSLSEKKKIGAVPREPFTSICLMGDAPRSSTSHPRELESRATQTMLLGLVADCLSNCTVYISARFPTSCRSRTHVGVSGGGGSIAHTVVSSSTKARGMTSVESISTSHHAS